MKETTESASDEKREIARLVGHHQNIPRIHMRKYSKNKYLMKDGNLATLILLESAFD